MLSLSQSHLDAMIEQAKSAHPIESCGLIAGPCGSDKALEMIPMINSAESEVYFRFDSKQQFRVWREMDDKDQEPVVIYHSHSASRAYPSRDDLAFSVSPRTHHVIVSTAPEHQFEVRSYRYINGRAVEETIKITQ